MDYIAYHETGPVHPSVPDQRMKPDAQQYIYDEKLDKYVPSGTGKGLFMFESHIEYDKEGKPLSTGGNMASNYLAQILKQEPIRSLPKRDHRLPPVQRCRSIFNENV